MQDSCSICNRDDDLATALFSILTRHSPVTPHAAICRDMLRMGPDIWTPTPRVSAVLGMCVRTMFVLMKDPSSSIMSVESYSQAFSPAPAPARCARPWQILGQLAGDTVYTGHNINIRLVTIMWESSPTAGSILYIPQKFGHISHVMCAVPTCETCARDRDIVSIGIGVDTSGGGDCKNTKW